MPSYALITGAGSAGLTWTELHAELDGALVLPVPDEPDVPAMAAALRERIEELEEPRVVVAASLGAMVALEVARSSHVDGLVLIAAGFGIEVSDALLRWVADGPPDLLYKVAKASLADRENRPLIEAYAEDLAARGTALLHRHLQALRSYGPKPLADPPPTVVVWGEHDHSVPLEDHVELALRCEGILVPVRDAGHAPFFERPQAVARWARSDYLWRSPGARGPVPPMSAR
jgi:pimeloyl-ACP methyl ester carboxylesterase